MLATLQGFNFYPLLFLLPFVVLLPLYIRAEKQGGFKKPTTLKLLLSGLCVICALIGFVFWGSEVTPLRALIVVALVFSFFGDYYLQFIQLDEKKYLKGLIFFSLTQLTFISYLTLCFGLSWPEFVITLVVATGALAFIRIQKWKLGKTGVPLVIYILLLVFMASKAVLAAWGAASSPSLILFAVGAVLFVISDLLTGINNYAEEKGVLGSVHLAAYFCGILCIALSCAY